MTRLSLKKYQQTTMNTAKEASPYQLVPMLFDKLLGNISQAKGNMQRGEISQKGDLISKAITILGVLESSLDFEKGGDVSENLASLYKFCAEKLIEANANNDHALLDEISQILLPIKAGWDEIPLETQSTVSF